MGYETSYSLEISSDSSKLEPIEGVDADGNPATIFRPVYYDQGKMEREIANLSGYSYPFEDSCKWYDHEADMRTYSTQHPDILFTLSGEGENSGDMWRKYFKNGKMQKALATISYDDFDESKLV